jgi:hypothetical protein
MHHKPKIERLKQDTSAHTSKAEKRSFPIFFFFFLSYTTTEELRRLRKYRSKRTDEEKQPFVLVPSFFFISATATTGFRSFSSFSLQSNEDTERWKINRNFPRDFSPYIRRFCVKDDDDDFEDHHQKRVEKEWCEFEVSQIVRLAFARFSRF